MTITVGRHIPCVDWQGPDMGPSAPDARPSINCRTLPCSAPRAAKIRTPIALGSPEEQNALIQGETSMGSIPIIEGILERRRAADWASEPRPPHLQAGSPLQSVST
jgi:hypothetical protein